MEGGGIGYNDVPDVRASIRIENEPESCKLIS